MKIIHTGDIHIGSAFSGLPRDKAKLRQTEILDGFCKLCAYAKQIGADAVLVAGDLFDTGDIRESVKREVFSAMENAMPVRFFYSAGNHDYHAELFRYAPQNFHALTNYETHELSDGAIVSGCNLERLTEFHTPFAGDKYNIFLLHGDIRLEIPLSALQNKGIDYLALGHIHKPTLERERLDNRGFYRYCGCLEGRGFDEVGARGFFLLEIVKGKLKDEKFLSFATRTVHSVAVDISACNGYRDIERAVENATGNLANTDLVKVVLSGSYTPTLRKDISLLSARLCERFFFAKVEDKSKLLMDYRDFEKDLTERGEFVREVGRYEMNADLRAEILEVGLKALAGEEIDL